MLWAIVLALVVLWLLGVVAAIGGALIHLLLVIAIVIAVAGFLQRNRTA
jgi:hypothetical protein